MEETSSHNNILIELFLTFLKIGAFTFGGGYAMIALLENEFVQKKAWISQDEFADMVAIAESTPGPVAINCATYTGYRLAGVSGSVTATAAICIPSVFIIMLVSLFYDAFMENKYVASAFWGIRICVVYLIGSVGFKMLREMDRNVMNICITVLVVAVMLTSTIFSFSCSTVLLILGCGIIGVIVSGLKNVGRKRER